MKHTIEAQFELESNRNPNLGGVIIFNKVVRGKNFPQSTLYKYFNKLIPTNEYAPNEKDEIFEDTLKINRASDR